MSMITNEEYENLDKSEWRKGQKAFNDLHQYEPEIANQLRGTTVDPFFSDRLLPEFEIAVKRIRKRDKND